MRRASLWRNLARSSTRGSWPLGAQEPERERDFTPPENKNERSPIPGGVWCVRIRALVTGAGLEKAGCMKNF
jgi:hypothetical protein